MKAYLDQIFYEGLGKSIYYPLEKKIKKINNKDLEKKLILIMKSLYFIFSIFIAICLFYSRL